MSQNVWKKCHIEFVSENGTGLKICQNNKNYSKILTQLNPTFKSPLKLPTSYLVESSFNFGFSVEFINMAIMIV